MGTLADHVAKLRLVIERGDVGRLDHLVAVSRHGVDQFYESGRLVRYFGQHLVGGQFLAMFFVVLADAKKLGRVRNRRQEFQPGDRAKQLCAFRRDRQIFQRRERRSPAGHGYLDRGRRHCPMQRIGGRNHVDDGIAADNAKSRRRRRFGKTRKTHSYFPPGNCMLLSFTSLLHLATSALM
jgi:hypothetical protein